MDNTPTYLGIFAIDPKSASQQLKSYSKSCIEQVSKHVNSIAVQQDSANFQTNFRRTYDNHHITTSFIANNKDMKQQKYAQILKTFKYDIKIDIKIIFCVYVQGVILAGYSPDTGCFGCDNTYPHVTLYLGKGIEAKDSNTIIKQVFTECPNICKQQFLVKQLKGKYNDHSIYIIKKEIIIGGVTGDNLKNGKKKE